MIRRLRVRWLMVRRLVAVSSAALSSAASSCSSSRPAPVSGYRILIEPRDSLCEHLAKALEKRGFDVRREVSGGSRPTAALITFTFQSNQAPHGRWFAARLADTRTGVVVASISLPLDSLGATPERQATLLADSLTKHLAP